MPPDVGDTSIIYMLLNDPIFTIIYLVIFLGLAYLIGKYMDKQEDKYYERQRKLKEDIDRCIYVKKEK